MKRDYKLFIKDILECIARIDEFIKGIDFDKFVQDDKTSSAVVRKIEIIGEATKNIPKHIRQRYKDVPWSDMAKMRDKITHFYFGIDYEVVWKVIKERLPEIKPIIHKILDEMEE
ncbi:MAG: hypothetical protein A3C43_10150 [Candidatus Schekmanbacteria bacterium RIFCSPHIGHO2_02_FULL_38_11]|uniref:DUF86 domain-containing protein n=1 Tax=Candidatus Schekmanbacteria bacterium RIFCSPLOWO2_12_FULL_38_15 TaxID=1817883 RepID=A0A1F7SNZ2_9BACT|nr:MAG: hypothetical protein A2043_05500 [Candidatus Schekmanbacteria bacterium GWA2_38_9]OGL50206.1 MAG: hypothetical protein A3H37_00405 [Candidatus Schekmanbacteria bacterium RIFCSPLOWO2_02_FULL_38_14]OGL50427.1 MAG: hypothetical protein A3C43_10150 [Candidatus Schekmanbacteria bacterium RIFCSPHIGHO2_02_FULL_38_11]OGL55483.1 MAG: hypothetical protein A3G31_01595 [Candidatus Schekmanbacteria bacterium RIFCSPLOWO2_12_FULL_38_15]